MRSQVSKPSSSYLLTKDKTILSSETSKLQRWAEYFADVSNVLRSVSLTPKHCQTSLQSHHLTDISFQKMKICLSLSLLRRFMKLLDNSKDGKAPGDDGISAELLKLGGAKTIRWLSSLFNSIWRSERIPSDWHHLNHPPP